MKVNVLAIALASVLLANLLTGQQSPAAADAEKLAAADAKIETMQAKLDAAQAALEAEKASKKRSLTYLGGGFLAVLMLVYGNLQRSKRRLRGELAEKNALLEEKRRRSEHLLLNILPSAVATELQFRDRVAARRYEKTTVMFVDFEGFTQISEQLSPEALVERLHTCFSNFDQIIGRLRVEKIKTAGDAYICASGLTDRNDSPEEMIRVALRFQEFLKKFNESGAEKGFPEFRARIGIHHGPVVAGVVGVKKFAYDIWGDTVNIAARLEAACEPGRINVSRPVHELMNEKFGWEYRGKIEAKNKGEIEMFYVL